MRFTRPGARTTWMSRAPGTAPGKCSPNAARRRSGSRARAADPPGSSTAWRPCRNDTGPATTGSARRRAAPVPDRRAEPRLPRLLRAPRVDRDFRPACRRTRSSASPRCSSRSSPTTACSPTVVAWDAGTSGRTEVFSEYKAQRRSRPDLLKQQWPAMEPLVEAFGYSQRAHRGLRGRRRDRVAGRARAARRPARAGDDRHRRPRRLPADRRATASSR